MAKTETLPWDAADHFDSPEAIAAYLNAAFEHGKPEFHTVMKVVESLGLRLSVTPRP